MPRVDALDAVLAIGAEDHAPARVDQWEAVEPSPGASGVGDRGDAVVIRDEHAAHLGFEVCAEGDGAFVVHRRTGWADRCGGVARLRDRPHLALSGTEDPLASGDGHAVEADDARGVPVWVARDGAHEGGDLGLLNLAAAAGVDARPPTP